jgi:demethylmenaquinone methyltransferase/2-methoxy-6-polyprenyl-1,4-benzoquinol methylase
MTSNTAANPRIEFFDRIADQWDGWHDLRELAGNLDAVLEKSGIDPGATVVDAGCGTGNLTVALLNGTLGPSGRVVAVDISGKMLDLARVKVTDPRVAWYCRPADSLPLDDGTVDHVICFSSWSHFHDPAAVTREFLRVLRSGGSLHILHLISRAEVNRIHAQAHPSVHHDILLPTSETARLLEMHGFRIIHMTDDDSRYLITARKPG